MEMDGVTGQWNPASNNRGGKEYVYDHNWHRSIHITLLSVGQPGRHLIPLGVLTLWEESRGNGINYLRVTDVEVLKMTVKSMYTTRQLEYTKS